MPSSTSRSTPMMMMQQQQRSNGSQAANFVRVAAKTAVPIVSSVPKCKSLKGYRQHPLNTVNGISYNNGQSSTDQHLHQQVAMGRSMRQQQQPYSHRTINDERIVQQSGEDDVVLIFSDDHLLDGGGGGGGKGSSASGMPMIGRRLASKSARAMAQQQLYQQVDLADQVIDYSQPPTIQVPEFPVERSHKSLQQRRVSATSGKVIDASMMHSNQSYQDSQKQPVVGRRSHRILEQHQRQQSMSQAQSIAHSLPAKSGHRMSATSRSRQLYLDYELHQDNNEQQFIHSTSGVHLLSKTAAHYHHHHPNHQEHMNQRQVASGNQSLMPSGGCSTSTPKPPVNSARQLINQHQLPVDGYSLPYQSHELLPSEPLKRRSDRKSALSSQVLNHQERKDQSLAEPYAMSCCSQLVEPSMIRPPVAANSCPDPRCCPPLPTMAPPSVIECSDPQCCPQFSSQEDLLMLQQQQHRSQRSSRHAKRLINSNTNPQQERDAYHRASSCSERRMLQNARGVAPPPVAAKPHSGLLLRTAGEPLPSELAPQMYHYSDSPIMQPNADPLAGVGHQSRSRRQLAGIANNPNSRSLSSERLNRRSLSHRGQPVDAEDPAAAAVTQMYESLAAELKAKLGNTKTAPILLPPKDYDTLSRKQGKLTGIELRRSTNPQLVGPIQSSTIPEAKEIVCGPSPVSSPARPLGSEMGVVTSRTETNHSNSNSFSDRSRSNSSSGLGSIVCGDSATSNASNSPESPGNCSSIVSHRSSGDNANRMHHHHHQHQLMMPEPSVVVTSAKFSGYHEKSSMSQMSKQQESQLMDSPSSGDIDSGHHNRGFSDTSGSSLSRCGDDDDDDDDHDHQQQLRRQQVNSNQVRGGRVTSSSSNKLLPLSKQESQKPTSLSSSPSSVSSTPSSARSPSASSSSNNMLHNNSRNDDHTNQDNRGKGMHNHHPSKVSNGVLWNGRVEIPLKVNSERNGNTYLATKQIIY